MICSSLNRVRFIVRLLVQDGLYLKLDEETGLRSLGELSSVSKEGHSQFPSISKWL